MAQLSVIVTILNERDNIRPLLERIHAALDPTGMDYEIIYVDDGSTDGSVELLKSLHGPRLVTVELRRNYGQSLALMAGIDQARGEVIATMDGDLQNDPADLPMMMGKLAEGWDLVVGERVNRQDGALLRRFPSLVANWIIRHLSGVHLRDYGCALKVFRAEIARDIGVYGELHRFISVLASLEGARITQVPVRHHARRHGKSKYGLGRTFRVVSDLMLMLFLKKYLQRPMHLFAQAGLLLFIAGALINIYLLILKIAGQDIWGKPLLILGALLVLAGIQLVTVGIIVEVLMRTYYESQQKRPYKIREVHESKDTVPPERPKEKQKSARELLR